MPEMKTARAHRKFAIYSNFLDTILEGEEEVLDGETRKDTLRRILKELETTANELKADAEINGLDLGWGPGIKAPPPTEVTYGPLPIISKDKDNTEIAIDNAQSLEELALIKESASKYGLVSHYMKRVNDLNKPINFTDGLE